jgi:hypothetical protein
MPDEYRIVEHPLLGSVPDAAPVTIAFDGIDIEARAGEPVAAALLAHGIRGFRTMPESDALRGVFTGAGRSLEELGSVDGEANVPLMSTPVVDGMRVNTQRGLGVWEDMS